MDWEVQSLLGRILEVSVLWMFMHKGLIPRELSDGPMMVQQSPQVAGSRCFQQFVVMV